MNTEQKNRFKSLSKKYIITLSIGLFYYVFIKVTKLSIPCIFHTIFDIYCPGCGISRMAIAMIRLDFRAAFQHNMLVFSLIPFALYLVLKKSIHYIKTGNNEDNLFEKIMYIIIFVFAVIFTILRNLQGFEYLAP